MARGSFIKRLPLFRSRRNGHRALGFRAHLAGALTLWFGLPAVVALFFLVLFLSGAIADTAGAELTLAEAIDGWLRLWFGATVATIYMSGIFLGPAIVISLLATRFGIGGLLTALIAGGIGGTALPVLIGISPTPGEILTGLLLGAALSAAYWATLRIGFPAAFLAPEERGPPAPPEALSDIPPPLTHARAGWPDNATERRVALASCLRRLPLFRTPLNGHLALGFRAHLAGALMLWFGAPVAMVFTAIPLKILYHGTRYSASDLVRTLPFLLWLFFAFTLVWGTIFLALAIPISRLAARFGLAGLGMAMILGAIVPGVTGISLDMIYGVLGLMLGAGYGAAYWAGLRIAAPAAFLAPEKIEPPPE